MDKRQDMTVMQAGAQAEIRAAADRQRHLMAGAKQPPMLSDYEMDPRLLGWLQARQDWKQVLLDRQAVRQIVSVLARVGAGCDQPAALRPTLEEIHNWMDSQADSQSKGGHATFDLMMLRELRDKASHALKGTPAAAVAEQTNDNVPKAVGRLLIALQKAEAALDQISDAEHMGDDVRICAGIAADVLPAIYEALGWHPMTETHPSSNPGPLAAVEPFATEVRLLELLREGAALMPLGSKRRAEWVMTVAAHRAAIAKGQP